MRDTAEPATITDSIRHRTVLFVVVLLAAIAAAASGCVFVTSPGQSPHAEWAGNYAQEQASEQDRDRGIALGVRDALAADPQLKKLGLRIFVDGGEVTLCGHYPDAATRARAIAVAGSVNGVAGVDADCGGH